MNVRAAWLAFVLAACATRTPSQAAPTPPQVEVDCEAVCASLDERPTSIALRRSDCPAPRSLRGHGAIEGKLVEASGQPAAGYTVVLSGGASEDTPSTETSPEGTFRFDDVASGRYQVTYSARHGNERLAVETCVVVEAGQSARVETRLGADPCPSVAETGTVEGIVSVPEGSGDRVYVNVWSRGGCLLGAAVTGPDGHFEMSATPSGEHSLVATYRGMTKEVPVRVAEGTTARVQVRFTSREMEAQRKREEDWSRCRCGDEED